MKTLMPLVVGLALWTGCEKLGTEVVFPPPPDLRGPSDLSMVDLHPGLRCRASEGLPGTPLDGVCIDMDQTTEANLTTLGFQLNSGSSNCVGGWALAGGQLSTTSLNTPAGPATCGMLLPSVRVIGTGYARITLAVIHKATLPGANQQARIELPGAPAQVLWNSSTSFATQRAVIEVTVDKIPAPGTNYQPSVLLYAAMGSPMPGWSIDSLAILGQLQ